MKDKDARQVCEYHKQCKDYDSWSERCNFRNLERFNCYAFQNQSINCSLESSRLVLESHKPSDLSQVASS